MKTKAANLSISGCEIDVSTEEGFREATIGNVSATPKLILLNDRGSEVTRLATVSDWFLLTAWR